MKKVLISLFLIFSAYLNSYSQQVYSPSPNSVAMGKFAETPVNLYNGLPNISVPIGEFNFRSASFPISLQYHASGVKVEDIPSWVGSNWSLSAGGMITRIVRGLPDESPKGYCGSTNNGGQLVLNYFNSTNNGNPIVNFQGQPVQDYYLAINNGIQDSEQDIFQFNINGYSGTFYLNRNGVPVIVPASDIRILPAFGPQGTGNWEIQTPDGTKYLFPNNSNYTETSEVSSVPENFAPFSYVSTWHLSELIQPNPAESARFYYETDGQIEHVTFSQTHYNYEYSIIENRSGGGVTRSFTDPFPGLWQEKLDEVKNIVKVLNPKRLSKIECGTSEKTSQIEFLPESVERLDLPGNYALKTIVFSDMYSGKILKKVNFSYKYYKALNDQFNALPNDYRNNRLFLTKVAISNEDLMMAPYLFEYDESKQLPNRYYNFEQDYWGYYSKNRGNAIVRDQHGNLTNNQIFNNIPWEENLIGMDRSGNPIYMGALSLKKITYPTGLSSLYEFEPHTAKNYSMPIGGLRIKKITEQTPNSPNIKTTEYTYNNINNPSESSGYLIALPECLNYRHIKLQYSIYYLVGVQWYQNDYYYRVRTNNSLVDLGTAHGHVGYQYVTVERKGEENSGKTVYEFTSKGNKPDFKLTRNQQGYVEEEYINGQHPRVSNEFCRGVLLKESVFDANSNLKNIISYHYDFETPNTYGDKMYSLRIANSNYLNIVDAYDADPVVSGNFQAHVYYTQPKWIHLDSIVNTTYDDNGIEFKTSTIYKYSYDNLQLSQLSTVDSDGGVSSVYYIYVNNYINGAGIGLPGVEPGVIEFLVDHNQINTIFEEVRTKTINGNTYVIGGIVNLLDIQHKQTINGQPYSFSAPSATYSLELETPIPIADFKFSNCPKGILPLPFSMGLFSKDERYKLQLEAKQYDGFGNIEEVKTKQGVNSIIYGYKNRYPIAKVKNAHRADIAYCGFEERLSIQNTDDNSWIWNSSSVIVKSKDYPDLVYAGNQSLKIPGNNFLIVNYPGRFIPIQQTAKYRVSYMVKGSPNTASIFQYSTFKEGYYNTIYPNIPESNVSKTTQNTGDWQLIEIEIDLGMIRQLGNVIPMDNLGLYFKIAGDGVSNNNPIYVDEIRVSPVDVVFETFSYEPSIGLTSQTDINNQSSFCEYDDLGRVSLISDHDRNILHKYTYYEPNKHLNDQWNIKVEASYGNTIYFIAESSGKYGEYQKMLHWDFGDGTTYSGTFTSMGHGFFPSGSYKVKLTVRDGNDNLVGAPSEISIMVY